MSVSPRFCSRCGTQLAADARYCAACGTPVAATAVSPSEASKLPPPPLPPTARSGSKSWMPILIGCGVGVFVLALVCAIFWGLTSVGSSSLATETAVAQATANMARTQTSIASGNATMMAANAQASATADAQATATANSQATQTAQAQANATANAQATQTAQAQANATASAQASQTAQAQANATANAQATRTAQAQANATASANATATAQAAIAAVNALARFAGQPVAVPDGRMDCSKSGTIGESRRAGVSSRNFSAEAQFFNPTDSSTHKWTCGFFFRNAGSNNQYRLVVSSDKKWWLVNAVGGMAGGMADEKTVAQGTVTNLDVSKDGTNQIGLVVNDRVAYFFLNGIYIATLDVSERNNSGDIFAGSGFTEETEFPGCSTPFKNFIVRALP